METFGQRLKKLIKSRNITQKQLSENLDITQSLISDYIKDKAVPTITKAKLIADYFGVDLNWLITGKTLEERFSPTAIGSLSVKNSPGKINVIQGNGIKINSVKIQKNAGGELSASLAEIAQIVNKLHQLSPEGLKIIHQTVNLQLKAEGKD
ncbi:MAG: hypothetical protein Kow0037_01060 [Calditrichia bacterium]